MAASPPPYTTAPSLGHLQGISHGFFGRRGGTSSGIYDSLNAGAGSEDDAKAVAENRARIALAIGARSADYLMSCFQHHSADALLIKEPSAERPKGDAMVCKTPGIALAIMTADCVPILFADTEAGVIGAAHAGWKGGIDGIVKATVEAMEAIGADTGRIVAAIGPSIGKASYEVGPEYRDRFLEDNGMNNRFFDAGKKDRFLFDIQGYIHAKLVRAGLSRVDLIAHDTCAMEADYFSNRRRNHRGEPDYGRNASVIMLKET
ncbi:MAG: peptidoglycan editing factor PgeF [Pseudomonadota bacterium]